MIKAKNLKEHDIVVIDGSNPYEPPEITCRVIYAESTSEGIHLILCDENNQYRTYHQLVNPDMEFVPGAIA